MKREGLRKDGKFLGKSCQKILILKMLNRSPFLRRENLFWRVLYEKSFRGCWPVLLIEKNSWAEFEAEVLN